MFKINPHTGKLDYYESTASLVPYTGATGDLDLGANNLSATGITAAGNIVMGGVSLANTLIEEKGLTIDGAGSVITTGAKACMEVPYDCTITQWTLISNDAAITSGSIVIDIWKDTYANYPPIVADSICGAGTKPNITTATKGQSSTFTNWTTTTMSAGDILRFNVDSVTSLKRVTLILKVRKT